MHQIEISLYLLAVLLATYAVWERFPKTRRPGQGLAFAGSLLTLFLTLFLTSLRIDRVDQAIEAVRQGLDAAILDERLRVLSHSTDPAGVASFELLTRASKTFSALQDSGQALLYLDEGVRFIAETVSGEIQTDPKKLEITAMSVDPEEFNRSPAYHGYEDAFSSAVERGASVERTYVLPEPVWRSVTEAVPRLSREPWLIADMLGDVGLGAIRRHYTANIRCRLVPSTALLGGKREDYDLVVLSRAAAVVLGANRIGEDTLLVALRTPKITDNWRRRYLDVRNHKNAVELPPYRPAPQRPIEVR